MKNSIEALEYLQTQVSEIIDHQDVEQTKEVSIKCQANYILIKLIK